jgi:hypothetical protein
MKITWLLTTLILVIIISGCIGQDGEITPTYSDNALKMDIKIREKQEGRRILPDQTIRMTVTLTNQVEDETRNVDLKITNPSGVHISKVDCGSGCVCEGSLTPVDCPSIHGSCSYNGCHYDSIQSLDIEDITFGLKIPSEVEMSSMGRDLNPKIVLEYDYNGTSSLYVPIYKSGEPAQLTKEFTQTTGPIHVDIDSDDWVRAGDLFPIYVDVKDAVGSSEKLTLDKNKFTISTGHVDLGDNIGKCDFAPDYIHPTENITLPLDNPLVCTLKAREESSAPPMVKAPIIIEYSYRYKVETTETIRVEKAFLRIF